MPQSDTEKLQRRNRELSILNTIAQAMNREIDLSRALRAALAQVAELLDLQTGWIWLLDEETGTPYLAAAQQLPRGLRNYPQRMMGSCYCLDTFRAGDMRGAANVNVITCSRLKWLDVGSEGLRYHASIPLYAHGKKMGVMNVASTDWRELSEDDLRILYTVGDLLGIAVERARLFARSADIGAAQERNRIAREIHDTLAQGLTAIALQLETADVLLETSAGASADLSSDPVRAQQAVRQALALARANLEEARRSVLDLRAAPLEGRTLPEALEALLAEVASRYHVEFAMDVTGDSRPLSPRLEMGLYRISQEALSNIVHHAQATRVMVKLAYAPDDIWLIIEDNGTGFDPKSIPAGRYGLIGLNERAHLLNGALTVRSAPGEGTRIEVTLPLEHRLLEHRLNDE
jgi:two-component system NarL family sensor kinase